MHFIRFQSAADADKGDVSIQQTKTTPEGDQGAHGTYRTFRPAVRTNQLVKVPPKKVINSHKVDNADAPLPVLGVKNFGTEPAIRSTCPKALQRKGTEGDVQMPKILGILHEAACTYGVVVLLESVLVE